MQVPVGKLSVPALCMGEHTMTGGVVTALHSAGALEVNTLGICQGEVKPCII